MRRYKVSEGEAEAWAPQTVSSATREIVISSVPASMRDAAYSLEAEEAPTSSRKVTKTRPSKASRDTALTIRI